MTITVVSLPAVTTIDVNKAFTMQGMFDTIYSQLPSGDEYTVTGISFEFLGMACATDGIIDPWADIKNDIIKHRYVLVGFLGWLLLLPLAITSSDKMIRRLKANWKRLHRLIYLIAILGVLHFIWLVKKDITEPLLYAIIIFILLE